MTNLENAGTSSLDLPTLEPHVATLASDGRAAWRLSSADLDVLVRAPLVAREIERLAGIAPVTRDQRWAAVEQAIDAAAETIGAPFSEAARHQFGLAAPDGEAPLIGERRKRAASALGKSVSWYRGTRPSEFGGLKPEEHVTRLISLGLLGAPDPVAASKAIHVDGALPTTLPSVARGAAGSGSAGTSEGLRMGALEGAPYKNPSDGPSNQDDIAVPVWLLALGAVSLCAFALFTWYSISTAHENLSVAEAETRCNREFLPQRTEGPPADALGQFIAGDPAFGKVVGSKESTGDPVTARPGQTLRVRIRLSNAGPQAIQATCVAAAVPDSAAVNPAVTFLARSQKADPAVLRDDVSVKIPGDQPACLEFVRGSGRVTNARLATIEQSSDKVSPIVPNIGLVDVGTEHTRSVGFDFKVVAKDIGKDCG